MFCLWRVPTRMRGDTLVALAIPTGCAALLAEAYFRTDNGDADNPVDARFGPSDACIASPHLVSELERNGIIVIPNAISLSALQAARDDIRAYQLAGDDKNAKSAATTEIGFHASTNDNDVRQDTIAWIRECNPESYDTMDSASSDVSLGKGLNFCIRFVRGISNALEQQGYVASRHHLVPRQCQLAIYTGDGRASYARHLDQCHATVAELGLLEWWRLSDYRERCITVILYLNAPDRPHSHGGALRCWVAQLEPNTKHDQSVDLKTLQWNRRNIADCRTFAPSFDIQPVGGTLIIFQSDRVDHQVLPSTVDRFALTNWVSSCAS
jgi:2OG-Fe(II) oxygenase superfamily